MGLSGYLLLPLAALAVSGAAVYGSVEWSDAASRASDHALRDSSLGALHGLMARGLADEDGIYEAVLMIQNGGPAEAVHLRELVLTLQDPDTVVHVGFNEFCQDLNCLNVLRDYDGSLQAAVLNDGDLVEFTLPLEKLGLHADHGERIKVTFTPVEYAPVQMVLKIPHAYAHERYVDLYLESYL